MNDDTTQYTTADDLVAAPIDWPEEDVEISGGRRVRVRALTRGQIIRLGRIDEEGGKDKAIEGQALALHMAMVRPEMTVGQARAWGEHGRFGDVEKVSTVINRLSGIGESQMKDAIKSPDGGER